MKYEVNRSKTLLKLIIGLHVYKVNNRFLLTYVLNGNKLIAGSFKNSILWNMQLFNLNMPKTKLKQATTNQVHTKRYLKLGDGDTEGERPLIWPIKLIHLVCDQCMFSQEKTC